MARSKRKWLENLGLVRPHPEQPEQVTFCGKVTFADERTAKRRISEIKVDTRNKRKHQPIRSYRCDYCGGWHLTSKAKAK